MEHSDRNLKNPDLATVKTLAEFFRIDRTVVPAVMIAMGVPKRGTGYSWLRIWIALGIDLETVNAPVVLKTPLLELKAVAAMQGESSRTTRRRSDGEHRDKSIPAHIDLGLRKRLFFPGEIQSWLLGEPKAFERKQENLSFIPAKKKKNSSPEKTRKEPKIPQPVPPSAAALFMGPLRPG